MIQRILGSKIKEQLKKFPVVAITGPRQSGKTTLAKNITRNYRYYNLEDINIKTLALNDPVGFISSIDGPAIIDEIQKVPELLSQIQVVVDDSKQNGQFIVTGSESLLLSSKISQSLAGRVANNTLLPLSYQELKAAKMNQSNSQAQILKGFYPRIYDTALTSEDFYPEYISTYVERDVRQLQNIGDLSLFEKFLQLLAGRVGQLLNYTSFSNDLGISRSTVENWISLLEASYIIYTLPPFYANLGKRLTKSPKIFFYDTGVLTNLLGIRTEKELVTHFAYGGIFENLVISEFMKHIYNKKLRVKTFFYRDSNGTEVDLILDTGIKTIGIEIKAAKTFNKAFLAGIKVFTKSYKGDFSGYVIYDGDQVMDFGDIKLQNLEGLTEIFESLN